jgi:hypothetical protein
MPLGSLELFIVTRVGDGQPSYEQLLYQLGCIDCCQP